MSHFQGVGLIHFKFNSGLSCLKPDESASVTFYSNNYLIDLSKIYSSFDVVKIGSLFLMESGFHVSHPQVTQLAACFSSVTFLLSHLCLCAWVPY